MTEQPKSETDFIAEAREKLVAAALDHVMFDGWSSETFRAAVADSGVDEGLARQAAPRGAIDLAVAFHRQGDQQMRDRMAATDQSAMRYSERVALAVRARLEATAPHRDAVRRGVTLFSLPPWNVEGAGLIWGTADAIWDALGDTSDDVNWYTKRATLSGVYSSTLLYWLGDDSEGQAATWAFLDRRIDNVMQIEKIKAGLRKSPLHNAFMAGPGKLFDFIKAPGHTPRDMPGYTGPK